MFRNYLSAALGNLFRSPLQSAITIGSLAIGLTAAILTGLLTRDAFSQDHFLPGYERTYFAVMGFHNNHGDFYNTDSSYDLAGYLREFPGITRVARESGGPGVLRHGNVQALEERLAWADPDFFRIYRAPALYGDLDHALSRPDGLVITRGVAEKYFGRDNAVGQMLEFGHEPEYQRRQMVVRAVIADWPLNASNFQSTVFASSLSPASRMSEDAGKLGMSRDGRINPDVITIVQIAPGASLDDLNRRAAALIADFNPKSSPFHRSLYFERGDKILMSPRMHADNRAILAVMLLVTLVILALSCFNYINLSIARSAQRGLEVAMRKAAGAGRGALVAQFLGEAVVQALLALCLAVALAEWALPVVDNFIGAGAVFDYWRDPLLAGLLLAGGVAIGVMAGFYPALILSAFRPALVLKGWLGRGAGAGLLRQAMVMLQFTALIVFLISAVTIFRQNRYASTEALNVSTDQVVTVQMPSCLKRFADRVQALPGVTGAACASVYALERAMNWSTLPPNGGPPVPTVLIPLDYGFLEFFGIKADAGRLFQIQNDDAIPENPSTPVRYIVNEAMAHALGYANAQAAIGHPIFDRMLPGIKEGAYPGIIIGVVRDFSFSPEAYGGMTKDGRIPPIAYSIGMPAAHLPAPPATLYIRLDGRNVPQTLAAIDAAWTQSGQTNPIFRDFLSVWVQNQISSVFKIAQAFAAFAIVAMLLGCFGLFGISLFAVERRTKEIGVRKAMGATSRQILRLLLWQFSWPILWANLIAWPLAWWLMQMLLSNFPYRVDLPLWTFLAAGIVTLAIALATVAGQAALVARQKPVLALRYE